MVRDEMEAISLSLTTLILKMKIVKKKKKIAIPTQSILMKIK